MQMDIYLSKMDIYLSIFISEMDIYLSMAVKQKILISLEKETLIKLRSYLPCKKGALSAFVEEAIREKLERDTHIMPCSKMFIPPCEDRGTRGDKAEEELRAIVAEISNMATIGGKIGKPLLMQVIAKATGLKDQRSITARLLMLESYGIIRREPQIRNVYEIVSLSLPFHKNFK